MSADHRKPVVAFVLLVFIAAALVYVQRADARSARFFAAFIGGAGEVHGAAPVPEGFLGAAGSQEWKAGLPEATAVGRGSVADDSARRSGHAGRRTDLRDEAAGELTRGRHGRPSVGKGSAAPGSEVAEAARRSGGARALQKAERGLLQDVGRVERGLRSSRRSAHHLPAGARRMLSREVERVEDRMERLLEARAEGGPLDR